MLNNAERMMTGHLYDPGAPELAADQTAALERLYDFNATRPSDSERRTTLLREMFASIGDGCHIEPPLHANWGGNHVHFGNHIYANFNLTLVDDGEIHVGDHVMFGPNVTITTAGHPIQPALREKAAQYNLPVHIGRNVWIGSGVQIMPGVTIAHSDVKWSTDARQDR